VLLHSRSSDSQSKPIEHPEPVKFVLSLAGLGSPVPYLITAAGEAIYTYDVEEFSLGEGDPTRLGVLDVHSHDVTALGVWFKRPDDIQKATGPDIRVVSGSLDGTIRQWKLGGNVSFCSSCTILNAGRIQSSYRLPQVPQKKIKRDRLEFSQRKKRGSWKTFWTATRRGRDAETGECSLRNAIGGGFCIILVCVTGHPSCHRSTPHFDLGMTVTIRPLSSDWYWKEYNPDGDDLEALSASTSSLEASDQWSQCAMFPSEIYVELIKKGSIPNPAIGFNEHLVQCSYSPLMLDRQLILNG
jgi:hypothetical protein